VCAIMVSEGPVRNKLIISDKISVDTGT